MSLSSLLTFWRSHLFCLMDPLHFAHILSVKPTAIVIRIHFLGFLYSFDNSCLSDIYCSVYTTILQVFNGRTLTSHVLKLWILLYRCALCRVYLILTFSIIVCKICFLGFIGMLESYSKNISARKNNITWQLI